MKLFFLFSSVYTVWFSIPSWNSIKIAWLLWFIQQLIDFHCFLDNVNDMNNVCIKLSFEGLKNLQLVRKVWIVKALYVIDRQVMDVGD